MLLIVIKSNENEFFKKYINKIYFVPFVLRLINNFSHFESK